MNKTTNRLEFRWIIHSTNRINEFLIFFATYLVTMIQTQGLSFSETSFQGHPAWATQGVIRNIEPNEIILNYMINIINLIILHIKIINPKHNIIKNN